MKTTPWIIVLALGWAGYAASAERPACRMNRGLEPEMSAHQYRQIAVNCEDPQLADLYYNRAYFIDLLARYQTTLRLETVSGQQDVKNYHAYRILIGLAEALAKQQDNGLDKEQWLNNVYDKASEIAELRLHGYELQANYLERQIWSDNPR